MINPLNVAGIAFGRVTLQAQFGAIVSVRTIVLSASIPLFVTLILNTASVPLFTVWLSFHPIFPSRSALFPSLLSMSIEGVVGGTVFTGVVSVEFTGVFEVFPTALIVAEFT